jgi:hypothetical protein
MVDENDIRSIAFNNIFDRGIIHVSEILIVCVDGYIFSKPSAKTVKEIGNINGGRLTLPTELQHLHWKHIYGDQLPLLGLPHPWVPRSPEA